jgi:hypothetical protein
MNTIKVKKSDLLDTLRTNKAKHEEVYEQAMVKYREALIAELVSLRADVEAGKQIEHRLKTVVPLRFADSYEQAIQMLEWEVGDEVELDTHEFQQYVMDDWNWGQSFRAANSAYVG